MTKTMICVLKKSLPRLMAFNPIFSDSDSDIDFISLFFPYCEEYRHMLYALYKFGAINSQDWNDALNVFMYVTTHEFDISYVDFLKLSKSDSFYENILDSFYKGENL